MKLFSKFLIILLFFFSSFDIVKAEQTFKFANIDLIINETKIGNQMLEKVKNLNKKNIEKLKSFESQIKEIQNDIQLKKNVISELEFDKEVSNLNKKISDFNNQKQIMVQELTTVKNKELKLFFENIKPIVQNYMSENSIDMIINSKNIFMGNKNSDITKELIELINIKF